MPGKIALDKGWRFKQASSLNNGTAAEFLPVAQFPTVAHLDLLHHGLIPDPYIDRNEIDTLWVNEADWTYRTEAIEPINLEDNERAILVFEGLDTVVDVYLNDQKILFSKNMHISHRIDVTDLLKGVSEASTLELRFRSAIHFSRQERSRIGYKGKDDDIHFGGSERLFLRKAQYHWGWDWGPSINTSGPWRPIYLETYVSRIYDLHVAQNVADDLKSADLTIAGSVENPGSTQEVNVELTDPSGRSVLSTSASISPKGDFSIQHKLENPELWYTFQYGAQPLYSVKASIPNVCSTGITCGLRRLRLLQHPLKKQKGTAFVFEVNNIRLFCGGSDWIPGDFMLPRMTRERYETWVKLAKGGNQAMIRVWGGGIVEDEAFYNACDREGVLVWQDFLFACGNYPASDDYVDNVRHEAEQQVKRVRHHPSLALWCGNNEDYMLADRFGWELDYKDEKGPWDKTNFPARLIYERTLPEVCERLALDVPYWRSSPYGGETSNDSTVGDVHIWDVWHGPMHPYQDYKKFTARFISEFGFESPPDIRTINKAITDPRERHSQSRTFDAHDKGPGNVRRYGMYMAENYRFKMAPLPDYIYCAQFLQAEAMRYAYNLWRREFRGPGEEYCAGVLVWQLNDIWPGTSWALVDVDLHRKPSFFITKRALAPMMIGIERAVTKLPPSIVSSYLPEKHKAEVWAVSGVVHPVDTVISFAAWDIETGKSVPLEKDEIKVTLAPNRTTELTEFNIPAAEDTALVAYLKDAKSGEVLARWVSWPEPLKYLRFKKDLRVDIKVVENGNAVILTANAPAKGVVLAVPEEDGDDAIWDDNFIDMVPGEEVTVKVEGLNGRKVKARFLCDWEVEA